MSGESWAAPLGHLTIWNPSSCGRDGAQVCAWSCPQCAKRRVSERSCSAAESAPSCHLAPLSSSCPPPAQESEPRARSISPARFCPFDRDRRGWQIPRRRSIGAPRCAESSSGADTHAPATSRLRHSSPALVANWSLVADWSCWVHAASSSPSVFRPSSRGLPHLIVGDGAPPRANRPRRSCTTQARGWARGGANAFR